MLAHDAYRNILSVPRMTFNEIKPVNARWNGYNPNLYSSNYKDPEINDTSLLFFSRMQVVIASKF